MSRLFGWLREGEWATPERLLRWGVFCAAVSLAAFAASVAVSPPRGVIGGDFIDFWSGDRLAAAGNAAYAYNINNFNAYERTALGLLSTNTRFFSYSPVAMLLWWPLSQLPLATAFALWTALGVVGCGILLLRLADWRAALLLSLAAPAGVIDAIQGQNGHLTALLLAGGLLYLEDRPTTSGFLFGLLFYKPQFGLMIPVALVAGRHRQSFAAATITVFLLVAASAAIFGGDAWHAYIFDQMSIQRRIMAWGIDVPKQWSNTNNLVWWHGTPTVFASARILGAGRLGGYFVQGASAVLAALAVAAVWRSHCPSGLKAACLIVAAFLATPYSWQYDMVALIFAAVWLARAGIDSGFQPWERTIAFSLVALPVFFFPPMTILVLGSATGVILRRALHPERSPLRTEHP